MSNAEMRCELTPCPRCGRRKFEVFRRRLVKNFGGAAAFVAFVVFFQYVSDANTFHGSNVRTVLAMYGALAVLLFGWIGIDALLEVRNASRKVRFLTA